MKKRMAYTIFALAIAGGCHRSTDTVQRTEEQYQVVEEGSTSGVTSTISGPGEVATNTAVDTTTNFTLPTATTDTMSTMPGSIAGTLPNTPPPVYTRPAVRPLPPQRLPVNPPMSSSAPAPRTEPPPPTPPTDQTTTQAEEPTDTAPPTTTTTEEKPADPQPQPPPTQTDTSGQRQ